MTMFSSPVTSPVVCALESCGAVYDPRADLPFLVLNPEGLPYTAHRPRFTFCQSDCMREFVYRDSEKRGRDGSEAIGLLDPAKVPLDEVGGLVLARLTELQSQLAKEYPDLQEDDDGSSYRARKAYDEEVGKLEVALAAAKRDLRLGEGTHLCSDCDRPLVGLEEKDWEKIHEALGVPRDQPRRFKSGRGPYIYLDVPDPDSNMGLSETLVLCGQSCFNEFSRLRLWRLDPRGYWARQGSRCDHCHSPFNPHLSWADRDGGWRVGGLRFCRPQCVVAHVEQRPWTLERIVWGMSEPRHRRRDWASRGCQRCDKEDTAPIYVTASAAEHYSLAPRFDDERPNHFCSDACLLATFKEEVADFEHRDRNPWDYPDWAVGKVRKPREASVPLVAPSFVFDPHRFSAVGVELFLDENEIPRKG